MYKIYLYIAVAIFITACGGSKKNNLDDNTTDQNIDTVPPIITIKGKNPKYRAIGRDYNDEGATAKDNVDGVVEVIATGEVDTLTKGTYEITYTAEDKAGNKATAVRKVIVEDITHNGISYGIIVSPVTGKIWLDKNLGAAETCESIFSACDGDFYQWGRNADGHEDSMSATRTTKISGLESSDGKFVIGQADWSSSTHRGANWSKLDGSSVCPVGFRVPTIDELKADFANYNHDKNHLKIEFYFSTRRGIDGELLGPSDENYDGGLWSSTVSGVTADNSGKPRSPYSERKALGAYLLNCYGFSCKSATRFRSNGYSIRCIRP